MAAMFSSCMVCQHDLSGSCAFSVPAYGAARKPGAPPVPGSAPGLSRLVLSPAPSASESERNEQRNQLRCLVHKFTADALRGVGCTVVDIKTRRHLEAIYKLDGSVSWLRFARRDGGTLLAEVPLTRIQRVTAYAELEPAEQEEVGSCVHDDARHSLLLVQAGYKPGVRQRSGLGPTPVRLFLMIEDAVLRESFCTCIEILRLYSTIDPFMYDAL